MNRFLRMTAVIPMLISLGCSTAPVADVLDFLAPSKMGTDRVPPYGGVCNPVSPPTPSPALPPPATVTPVSPVPSTPPVILPPTAPPGAR